MYLVVMDQLARQPDGATQVSGLTAGPVAIIVVIWLIIGIINVAYARRR